jgi:hypothetical protein
MHHSHEKKSVKREVIYISTYIDTHMLMYINI